MNEQQSISISRRGQDTIRLLEWIQDCQGLWRLICTPNDPNMTCTMMKQLIQQLADKQFYEIIFVLLTVHRNQNSMALTLKGLFVRMISAGGGKAKCTARNDSSTISTTCSPKCRIRAMWLPKRGSQ